MIAWLQLRVLPMAIEAVEDVVEMPEVDRDALAVVVPQMAAEFATLEVLAAASAEIDLAAVGLKTSAQVPVRALRGLRSNRGDTQSVVRSATTGTQSASESASGTLSEETSQNAFSNVTDAEIESAVNADGRSNIMLTAPAPGQSSLTPSGAPTTNVELVGFRFRQDHGMMVNEHTVQSTSSAHDPSGSIVPGNVATRIRVHTADPNPTLPATSNSASGNTLNIVQGGRRFVPDESPRGGTWHLTSKMDEDMINRAHIPIHR